MKSAHLLLKKYYLPHTMAYRILLKHSSQVADKAVKIADNIKRYSLTADIDVKFIAQAAMLHDIGIFATATPSLGCYGHQPYLRHGIIGYTLLIKEGLPRHAEVCANHIGVGLTAAEILSSQLPLPAKDFIPQTIEEQIITYADLFFSKNPVNAHSQRSITSVRAGVAAYGTDKVAIFDKWRQLFEPETIIS